MTNIEPPELDDFWYLFGELEIVQKSMQELLEQNSQTKKTL